MQKNTSAVSHAASPKKPRKSIHWDKIKQEYLDGTSISKLSSKYGVSKSTISSRISKEKWKELSEQISNKTEQKLIERKSSQKAQIKDAYNEAVFELLNKTLDGLKTCAKKDSKSLKEYSSILKDLKDIGIYRTNLDLKEQRAKIDKLREKDDKTTDKELVINIVGGEDYAN